jgi:1-deoxy-D-xylulose-5-phosphate reductoisomerase
MSVKKRIAIFGSTGSIGTQALSVIAANPHLFEVEILTCQTNANLIIEQALKFNPNVVVVGNEQAYQKVKAALANQPIKVFAGEKGMVEAADFDSYDIMIAAIVGFAGLKPTLAAIKNGKTIALANKETLVVAGELVIAEALKHKAPIIPVDSEHSAIFQCLVGETRNKIEEIILTASGGPFLGKKPNYLMNVRKEHALQHPNWSMGAKITIDSATLMNKGLEVIEAKWLFNLKPEQIKVIIHPQSIIHSMVMFNDGSIKAQLGLPDMKLPIQYALAFPARIENDFPRCDFKKIAQLSFEEPDIKTFRNLALAQQALISGGNIPCALNAANEEVVYGFLKGNVGFMEMTEIIETVIEKIHFKAQPSFEDYLQTDAEARAMAKSKIKF